MSSFITSHDIFDYYFGETIGFIIELEGKYSNDPNDPGGETVYGISRVNHPNFYIWSKIDEAKSHNQHFSIDKEDFKRIISFYSKEFRSFEKHITGYVSLVQYAQLLAFHIHTKDAVRIISYCNIHGYDNIDDVIKSRYENIVREKPKLSRYKQGFLNRVTRIQRNFEDVLPAQEGGFSMKNIVTQRNIGQILTKCGVRNRIHGMGCYILALAFEPSLSQQENITKICRTISNNRNLRVVSELGKSAGWKEFEVITANHKLNEGRLIKVTRTNGSTHFLKIYSDKVYDPSYGYIVNLKDLPRHLHTFVKSVAKLEERPVK